MRPADWQNANDSSSNEAVRTRERTACRLRVDSKRKTNKKEIGEHPYLTTLRFRSSPSPRRARVPTSTIRTIRNSSRTNRTSSQRTDSCQRRSSPVAATTWRWWRTLRLRHPAAWKAARRSSPEDSPCQRRLLVRWKQKDIYHIFYF